MTAPPATRRGTTNRNARGSSYSRRTRKVWLLATFGNGTTAPCSFPGCTDALTFETITVDRFPVPGYQGGGYARGNIRPACARHNSEDGGRISGERRRAAVRT